MTSANSIEIVNTPSVKGSLVLTLTPKEAFMLGKIARLTKYLEALDSVLDEDCTELSHYPDPNVAFTIDDVRDFLDDLSSHLTESFK